MLKGVLNMKNNFTYYNPTKIYFGKGQLKALDSELKNYGKNILLVYGGGSIKKIGLYDHILEILKSNKKNVIEISNVLPNPLYEKVLEGANAITKNKISLILAVGGGSVIDCAKAMAAAVESKNPWQDFWIDGKDLTKTPTPIGAILTMTGTGSEMNGGSVITNNSVNLKKGRVFPPVNYPKFAILDPEFTYTVSEYQMLSGIFDIFSHLMEQYFSDNERTVSDYLLESLMKVLIDETPNCIKNKQDYKARSNIMWASTMALNTITGLSKSQDWEVHAIEHQISAYTNCAHGMGLACISVPYYRFVMPHAINKFKEFAINVFSVNPSNKSDEQIANEGINLLDKFIKDNKMHYSLKELGCTKEMLPLIANSCDKGRTPYTEIDEKDILSILEKVYE